MIVTVIAVIAWTIVLGLLAQSTARRRGLPMHGVSVCWLATASIAAFLAATSCVKFSLDAALVVLAVGAVVDARTGYIFDPLVVAGGIGVLVATTLEGTAVASLYGAAIAGGAVFCLWALTLGRGIGLGDVKLAAVVGAGFGPLGGISAIGLSFIVGGAVSVARMIAGKAHFGAPVRFGPYLLAGSVCLLAYHRLSDGVIR